jgi:acetyl-CoA carboxylase biotin carboxyl carrier protein
MELKQIKELMRTMGLTDVKSIFLKKDGFELKIEKFETNHPTVGSSLDSMEESPFHYEKSLTNLALSKGKDAGASLTAAESHISHKEDPASLYITSPMVGTFYASPSPDESSFVKIGSRIDKGSVVCIIEAMKVMNEIKSNIAGEIVEILIENGHPVEFGTKLFRII